MGTHGKVEVAKPPDPTNWEKRKEVNETESKGVSGRQCTFDQVKFPNRKSKSSCLHCGKVFSSRSGMTYHLEKNVCINARKEKEEKKKKLKEKKEEKLQKELDMAQMNAQKSPHNGS